MTERRQELAAGLEAVREQVAGACERSGRSPGEVTLIAVTKLFPASDIALLADLGVRDIGENRDQEARAKHAECADIPALRWHFVGQVQTNKARSVASYADIVHSVDRGSLVGALARARAATGASPLDCLIQVRLDDRPGRGGAEPQEVPGLAAAIASTDVLRLAGVMGVAPLDADPRPAFERLAAVRQELLADHPGATWMSAGMSDDLEVAVETGATHLRVGRKLLGERPTRR